MRAVMIPLFLVLCAALAHAQGDIPAPPPKSGGLIDVATPVEVVVPALIHESLIFKTTGANWSAATVNATYANVSQALQLPFKGEPMATNDSIGIGLIVVAGTTPAAPLTTELVRESVFPARDIEVLLSEANANVLMNTLWSTVGLFSVDYALPFNTGALEQLLPEVYAACGDCPLSVAAQFPGMPAAFFNQSAAFVFSNLVGSLNAAGPNGTVTVLELLFNGTIVLQGLSATNASGLGIQLDLPSFVATVNRTVISSIDSSLVGWLAQSLVTHVLVTEINSAWQSLGVAIPMFGNAKVIGLELMAGGGAVNIGADLDVSAGQGSASAFAASGSASAPA